VTTPIKEGPTMTDKLWNGRSGNAWTQSQGLLDALFQPLEDLLIAGVSGGDVLDVGCGTGGTTVAAARRARALGIDVSTQMIEAARRRTGDAEFVVGDAQEHPFVPSSFDLVISRFGVMFFADPVRAFTNLHAAARPGAGLRLLVWRGAAENPFMTTAERAAASLLPVSRPDGPGQFAFADPDRVTPILRAAGWSEIDFAPVDEECGMPESELVGYFTRLGPVGLALAAAPEKTPEVVEAVRPAFDPFVRGDRVRFTAACHLITARRVTEV
jgi:SAM-dependent methyltransferase